MSEYEINRARKVHEKLYKILSRLKGIDSPNWLKKEIDDLVHESDCVRAELQRIYIGSYN